VEKRACALPSGRRVVYGDSPYRPLFQSPEPARASAASVTFEPGADTRLGILIRSGRP